MRACFVIDTAVVRYVEDHDSIQVKVAGSLDEDLVRRLSEELAEQLSRKTFTIQLETF